MDARIADLANYRLEKAKKNLAVAQSLLKDDHYNVSINRSYYAVFDAMRAVNALDGFDSSKHSGVISHFNQYHVKTGDFSPDTSVIIRRAASLREKSDYEDFFEADKTDAKEVLDEATAFKKELNDS